MTTEWMTNVHMWLFYAKSPKCWRIFVNWLNFYTVRTTLCTFMDCWPGLTLSSSNCPQVAGRWCKKCTSPSIHRIKKWYKGRSSWAGQVSAAEACLNGGPAEPWRSFSRDAESERSRWPPNESNSEALLHTSPWYMWPRDSVLTSAEVEHYFPSRSPCSLPQIQFITSSLSAARSRWLRTRPEGTSLGLLFSLYYW